MSITVSYRHLTCGFQIASVAIPMYGYYAVYSYVLYGQQLLHAYYAVYSCFMLHSIFVASAAVSSASNCGMPFSAYVAIKVPPFHVGCCVNSISYSDKAKSSLVSGKCILGKFVKSWHHVKHCVGTYGCVGAYTLFSSCYMFLQFFATCSNHAKVIDTLAAKKKSKILPTTLQFYPHCSNTNQHGYIHCNAQSALAMNLSN